MKMKKVWEVVKNVGECFTMAAGVVSLGCGIVSAFTGIGIILPLVLVVGVGLIAAGVGGYYTYRKLQAKEGREREELADRNSFHAAEAKLTSFAKDMDAELKDIKRDIAEHHSRSFRGVRKPRRYYSGTLFNKAHCHHQPVANDATFQLRKAHSNENVVNFQMK